MRSILFLLVTLTCLSLVVSTGTEHTVRRRIRRQDHSTQADLIHHLTQELETLSRLNAELTHENDALKTENNRLTQQCSVTQHSQSIPSTTPLVQTTTFPVTHVINHLGSLCAPATPTHTASGRPTAVPIAQAPLPPSDRSGFMHDGPNGASWRDCGSSVSWIHVQRFDLQPHPFRLHGPVSMTLHATVNHDLHPQDMVLDVILYKMMLTKWFEIPCTIDLGTCRYTNICDYCACQKSITAGTLLNINNEIQSFAFISEHFRNSLSWIETGDYYLKMILYEKGSAAARGCFELFFYTTERA
ncbi:hypothetical protein BaRGS_00031968 [Batillaria attramentaria]|uniref:Uncharacterized protein n=1 Tax=Batillaria attramentaria TaxID=370345 RepID=A0ABD0JQM7_9CAEN